MSLIPPPNPRDIQDFQFKLICRLRVFSGQDGEFSNSVNLIAAASKYDLIFVGTSNGLQVIIQSSILGLEHPSGAGEIIDYPRREVPLSSRPTHLGVSCDQNHLAVAIRKDGCAHALVYSVASFVSRTVYLVSEFRLSTDPAASILELVWNPGMPTVMGSCLSDGSVGVYELKAKTGNIAGIDINGLPPEAQATCFCWSPKGKQLVVGSANGSLTQYKPDLKAVKNIPTPPLWENPTAVVNVLWISNYQFAVIYSNQVDVNERPALVICNAPKDGSQTFVNFEDICYSCGDLRDPQFYLIHQPTWNMLIVGSANSVEVGVLGLTDDRVNWEQWVQEDAARAELPLAADKQETYPVGLALDYSNQKPLPWGENQTIPPMPVLHVLSHRGVLCLFYAINIHPNAPLLCVPPERLPDVSGLALFTTVPSSDIGVGTKSKPQLIPSNTPAFAMWNSPVQPATDSGRSGLRVNLAEKFETFDTQVSSAGSSLFKPTPEASKPFSFGSGVAVLSTTGANSSLASSAVPSLPFGQKPTAQAGPTFGFSELDQPAAKVPSIGGGLLETSPSASGSFTFSLPGAMSTPQQPVPKPAQQLLPAPQPTRPSQPASKPQGGLFNVASTTSSIGSTEKPQAGVFDAKPTSIGPGSAVSGASVGTTKTKLGLSIVQSVGPSVGGLTSGTGSTGSTGPAKSHSGVFNMGSKSSTVVMETAKHVAVVAPKLEVPLITEVVTKAATGTLKRGREGNTTILQGAISGEMNHFQKELVELRASVQAIRIEVGTPEEKGVLCHKTDEMDEFSGDLKDTTKAQNLEVLGLKSVLVEAFSWAEDAMSRIQQLISPRYMQMMGSQELDSVSNRYLNSVRHLMYYVDGQLRQLNQTLDLQWGTFADSCKDKIKSKMQVPSLEAVYQSMVLLNSILSKQKMDLDDLLECMGRDRRNSSIVSEFEVDSRKGDVQLSQLAETLLHTRLDAIDIASTIDLSQLTATGRMSAKTVATRKLTSKKQAKLFELLVHHPISRVRPLKPSRVYSNSILAFSSCVLKSFEGTPSLCDGVNSVAQTADDSRRGVIAHETVSGFSSGKIVKDQPNVKSKQITKDNKPADIFDQVAKSIFLNQVAAGAKHSEAGLVTGQGASTEPFVSTSTSGSADTVVFVNKPVSEQSLLQHPQAASVSTPAEVTPKSSSNFVFFSSGKSQVFGGESNKSSSTTPSSVSASVSTTLIFGGTRTNASPSTFTFQLGTATPMTSATSIFGSGTNKSTASTAPSAFNFSLTTTTSAPDPSSSIPSIFGGSPVSKAAPSRSTQSNFPGITRTSVSDATQLMSNKTSSLANDSLKISPVASSFSFVSPATESSAPSRPVTTTPQPIFSGMQTKQPTTETVPEQVEKECKEDGDEPVLSASEVKTPSTSSFNFGPLATLILTTTTVETVHTPTVTTAPASFGSALGAGDSKGSSGSTEFSFSQMGSVLSIETETNAETSKASETESTGTKSTPLPSAFSQPITTVTVSTVSASLTSKTTFSFTLPATTTSATNPIFGVKPGGLVSSNTSTTMSAQTTAERPFLDNVICTPIPYGKEGGYLFSVTTKPSALFGGVTPLVSTTSLFGGGISVTTTTTSSAFSSASVPAVTTCTPSLFGNTPAGTVNTASLFGGKSTESPSIFGNVTASTKAAPLFGSTTASSTSHSLFGGTTVTTSTPSLFGCTTTTTTPSLFGSTAITTTASSPSLFGSTAITTTASSIFGSVPVTSTQSLFGSPTTTSAPPLFGPPATTSASPFGQSTASAPFSQGPGTSFLGGATGEGAFGSKPAFGQSGGSLFGQSSSSTFGSSSGSIFGGPSAFGGQSLTTGNIFQPAAGGSVFGSVSPPASPGAAASGAFSSSLGQSINQSGFGSPPAFQSKPGAFGGSPVFGQASAGSGFGTSPTFGGAPTFGGSPTFGSPNRVFGSNSPPGAGAFGSTSPVQQSSTFESLATQNTMTFGNLASSQSVSFGAPQQPAVFGTGPLQSVPISSPPAFSTGSGGSSGGGGSGFGGSSFSSWR